VISLQQTPGVVPRCWRTLWWRIRHALDGGHGNDGGTTVERGHDARLAAEMKVMGSMAITSQMTPLFRLR
jgi:hypothetical protein